LSSCAGWQILKDRWPNAKLTGLDTSKEMIASTRVRVPGVAWVFAAAAVWTTSKPYDGVLAVQIPSTHDSPFHRALHEVSGRPEWNQMMEESRSRITHDDESFSYDVLSALTDRLELWTTTYHHILEDHDSIVEWYSATSLKPYLEKLQNKQDATRFCGHVPERCKAHYPRQKNGKIAFPFKPLFFVARKGL